MAVIDFTLTIVQNEIDFTLASGGNTIEFLVITTSGAVLSVNGNTGVVVLDPDDLDDTATTNKFVTASDITLLGNTSGTNTGDQDLSGKQDNITLTTTGTSGAATFAGDVLNIPQYSDGGGGAIASKTGSTIVFTEDAEYNAVTPVTSGNITIDPTGAIAGKLIIFYINSTVEPGISGATKIKRTGSFVSGELNVYHFMWSGAGGYLLAIQSNVTDTTLLSFSLEGFTLISEGIYENTAGQSYDVCYGVSINSYAGDFSFEIEIPDSTCYGSMLGLSTSGINRKWNDTTPWKYMAFLGALAPVGQCYQSVDGGTLNDWDTPTTIIAGGTENIELRRVSDNVKIYNKGVEVHNFGTLSGSLYLHISTFTNKFLKYPQVIYI